MEDKIKVHEQLLELLNEKYITRGEYLISLKENLFTLKDRIKIHEQLDELLKNDNITKDEYLIFIKENILLTKIKIRQLLLKARYIKLLILK